MKSLIHQPKLVYLVLLFWLFASNSGMHGHYCFDGQEPPVTVHLDVMTEHPDHHLDHQLDHHQDEQQHVDADVDLFKLVFVKIVKIDVPLLLATLFFLLTLSTHQQVFFSRYSRHYSRRVIGLRPPLRAPPVIPACF